MCNPAQKTIYPRWIVRLIVAVALIASATLGIWTASLSRYVQLRREELLSNPDPVPEWILAVGPKPGETLSVAQARFGDNVETDPFWPGYGVVCVQLNGAILPVELNELHSRVALTLNGYRIRELGSDRLIHGWRVTRGFVLTSVAEQTTSRFNVCWRMILQPDKYLAALHVSQMSGSNVVYEWAFRLTEK